MVVINRFDVLLVALDPTVGSELKKTRPCLVISPNSLNYSRLNTLIVAPMTSTIRPEFPTRISVEFKQKQGQIALDQLRVIDRKRVVKKAGSINSATVKTEVFRVLRILFEE